MHIMYNNDIILLLTTCYWYIICTTHATKSLYKHNTYEKLYFQESFLVLYLPH